MDQAVSLCPTLESIRHLDRRRWARRRRIRSKESGFTLIEMLLATILLVTGFFALSEFFSQGLFAAGSHESELLALNLAQDKMEEVRNAAYDSIANESRAPVSGFSAFERELVVTTPIPDLKEITVRVFWNHKADEVSTALVTYAAKP